MPWSQGNPLWNDPGSPWRGSEFDAGSGNIPGLLEEDANEKGPRPLEPNEFAQRPISKDPFELSSRGLDLSWGQLLPSQPSLSLHQYDIDSYSLEKCKSENSTHMCISRLGGLGNAGGPLVYGSCAVGQDDKEVCKLSGLCMT
eukprot:83939-Hanusia_phi.AAC.9